MKEKDPLSSFILSWHCRLDFRLSHYCATWVRNRRGGGRKRNLGGGDLFFSRRGSVRKKGKEGIVLLPPSPFQCSFRESSERTHEIRDKDKDRSIIRWEEGTYCVSWFPSDVERVIQQVRGGGGGADGDRGNGSKNEPFPFPFPFLPPPLVVSTLSFPFFFRAFIFREGSGCC